MTFVIVIPARFASVRLPGKLLKPIHGKPLLQYTYEQASQCGADEVYIATDDQTIYDTAITFGAKVCMTSDKHTSGTQRIHEVIEQLHLTDETVVVNVQGDEPLMPPSCISQVAALLDKHPHAGMATLCTPLVHDEEVFDSSVVKVVTDNQQRALYFSRATIPWYRDAFTAGKNAITDAPMLRRHIGLYAYRAGFIREYQRWQASPLEQIEALEQLRVLWHGGTIVVEDAIDIPGPGVDTESDLNRVTAIIGKQQH